MPNKELEFRGINRTHLAMYLEELGGRLITDSFPYIYEADDWKGEILGEEEKTITSTFKVNAVYIRFNAEEEDKLNEIIKKYRYKTTRVGG